MAAASPLRQAPSARAAAATSAVKTASPPPLWGDRGDPEGPARGAGSTGVRAGEGPAERAAGAGGPAGGSAAGGGLPAATVRLSSASRTWSTRPPLSAARTRASRSSGTTAGADAEGVGIGSPQYRHRRWWGGFGRRQLRQRAAGSADS